MADHVVPPWPELTPDSEWAAVEVMGHRQHLGALMEVERFGVKMLRIDVPKVENGKMISFESIFYAASSIFSIRSSTPEAIIGALQSRSPFPALSYIEDHTEED
jgi:hypothetical protein